MLGDAWGQAGHQAAHGDQLCWVLHLSLFVPTITTATISMNILHFVSINKRFLSQLTSFTFLSDAAAHQGENGRVGVLYFAASWG